MGGLSIWHLLVLMVLLGIPAAIVGGIVWWVAHALRRATARGADASPRVPAERQPSAASRLKELASLKAGGLITEAEYERRRAAIVDGL